MSHGYTINCDLGEGVPREEEIIPMIDLASVACGGHFGDRDSILKTLKLIRKHGKKAGAHPSYPDRTNFGRVTMDIAPRDLVKSLNDQLRLFSELAEEVGIPVDHVKFHGALYNDAAANPQLAELLVDFLSTTLPLAPVLVPPYSEMQRAASERSHPIRLELFGDRAYQDNYRLVSRTMENSLLTDYDAVSQHLDNILLSKRISTVTGNRITVQAHTICFHGDNPGLLDLLPRIRRRYWT